MVTLEIDGQEVTVPEGTSIMRAAAELGIMRAEAVRHRQPRAVRLVPPLPRRDRGPQGHAGLLHHARRARHEGGDAERPKLARIRKGVMELYISDHPLDCLTCAANGDCELQDMAGAVGLRDVRYGYEGANHVFARRTAKPIRCAEGRRPTPTSRSTRRSASSARAASAPARKCRARSR